MNTTNEFRRKQCYTAKQLFIPVTYQVMLEARKFENETNQFSGQFFHENVRSFKKNSLVRSVTIVQPLIYRAEIHETFFNWVFPGFRRNRCMAVQCHFIDSCLMYVLSRWPPRFLRSQLNKQYGGSRRFKCQLSGLSDCRK